MQSLRGNPFWFLAVGVVAMLLLVAAVFLEVDVRSFSGRISYIEIPSRGRVATVHLGTSYDGLPMDISLAPSGSNYWAVVIGDWPKDESIVQVRRTMVWSTNSVGPKLTLTIWENLPSSRIRKK